MHEEPEAPPEPARNPEELVAFLRERLGDDFRSLVEYRADDQTIHYVKEGIDSEHAEARLQRIRHLYEGEVAAGPPVAEDVGFGPLYASTHIFGGAIVIHVLDATGSAIGFSVDHRVGGNLTTFVRECIEVLYDNHPWEQVDAAEAGDPV